MSKRRSHPENRCIKCQVNEKLCFCEKILNCDNRSTVSVVMHFREEFLTSNSSYLGNFSLNNFSIHTRGRKEHELSEKDIIHPDCHQLILFPDKDSVELTSQYLDKIDKPIQLIVPDGTWKQAKRIRRRVSFLKDIPSVKVTTPYSSRYFLRKQANEFGMGTYEAIALALGLIDNMDVQKRMLDNFDIMVHAHLLSRNYICSWPRIK